MDISLETHFLVVDEERNPIVKDGRVLLQCKNDESSIYTPLNPHIQEEFGVTLVDDSNSTEITSGDEDISPISEKFVWQHNSTLLLLDEYKKRIKKFKNPKVKKKLLWNEISHVMTQNGYTIDSDSLDRKIRNMKTTYRTILDNNKKKKSTGRRQMRWPYFNIFEEILEDDKSVNCSSVTASTQENLGFEKIFVDLITRSPELTDDENVVPSINERPTSSASSCGSVTPGSSKKYVRSKQLDKFRSRQLEIEEEKLLELKRLRESIDKNNEIQEKKIKLLELIIEKQGFKP